MISFIHSRHLCSYIPLNLGKKKYCIKIDNYIYNPKKIYPAIIMGKESW